MSGQFVKPKKLTLPCLTYKAHICLNQSFLKIKLPPSSLAWEFKFIKSLCKLTILNISYTNPNINKYILIY